MKIPRTQAAAVLAFAGALATTAATPSFADSRWGYAAGGFAVGAVVGAAAANANARYYYGPGYAYYPYGYAYYPYAYEGYAYEPAPAEAYAYEPAPAAPVYSYGPAYYSYSYVPLYKRRAYDPDPRIGGSFKMKGDDDD